MKQIFFLSVAVIILNSCAKDSPSIPDPNGAPTISAIPSSFVQKIVIENFTMTSCGQCPKYDLMLDSLVRYNDGRVYALTNHVGDIMLDTNLLTSNGGNYYDSVFNPVGLYPSGMVNRHLSSLNELIPDNWPSSVFSMLGNAPVCGVAIEAENVANNFLNMTVHVGFTSALMGQYNLHAFIVADQVYSNDSAYLQINDYSSEGATPDSNITALYNQNDSIHPYRHKYVLKKVIANGGPEGDPIPTGSTYAGNHYTANYVVNLTGIDIANSYILVYVDKYATTYSGHRIANAQVVRIGENKDWN